MYTKIHKLPTGHQPCKRIRTLRWVRDPTKFINQSVSCLRHKSKQPLREASEQRKECHYITTSRPPAWNVLHTNDRSSENISQGKVLGKAFKPPTHSIIIPRQSPCSRHVALDCSSNPRLSMRENRCGAVELQHFPAAR